MRLDKNLGARVVEKIPRGPKNVLKKHNFLAKKVKILGGERVAFNKNFVGGRGYLEPPLNSHMY